MIRFLCLFVFSALLLPLPAQENVRMVSVRCLAFQLRGKLPDLYAHNLASQPGTDGIEVKLLNYLNHMSQPLPLLGAEVVFTTSPDPESVKDKEKVVARTKIPATMTEGILLFVTAAKDNPEPCLILPIADDRKGFPSGSLKVVNLSPKTVRLTLQKNGYEFKPGEVEVIKDLPVNERQQSEMYAFVKEEEGWKKFGAGLWPHPGPARVFQVIYENPRNRQVEIKGIQDTSAPKPAPEVP